MEAIREIKRVTGERIMLDLPVRFKNMEVEIIILPFKAKQVKTNDRLEPLMLSESALKKDWNLPQEDKAWQNL